MSRAEKYSFPEAQSKEELLIERKELVMEIDRLDALNNQLNEQIRLYKYILYLYERNSGFDYYHHLESSNLPF